MIYNPLMNAMAVSVILVDWKSDEPVYAQIARQIRSRIAAGELPAGMPLPSVRSVASDLGINLNTVARAYRILEEERFITIRDRAGAVVAPPSGRIDQSALKSLDEELSVLLARMRQAGLSTDELRRRLDRVLAALNARDTANELGRIR
jgi:GntR family transcriptional regulator